MFRFVRLSKFLLWFASTMLCGGIFVLASFYLYLNPNLPAVEQLKDIQLQTPLRIYTSDNKLIGEFGEKRRTPVEIAHVPEQMVQAFIAAEDSRFFQHNGIDFKGLARAATQLISTGKIQTGGSTITMQVAKNFFLSREKKFIRKFNEILLALQIEQSLSKLEILELYLNKIYLGHRAYGVQAAAQVYYGKDVRDLTLAENAMIAGLPKAPSRFNPIANPDRARIRRDWILDRMSILNAITEQEKIAAQSLPIIAALHGSRPDISAPYIAEMARREVLNQYGRRAYTDGFKVFVTVNSKNQLAATQALKDGLIAYDRRHGFRGPEATVATENLESRDLIYDQLRSIKELPNLIPAVLTTVGDTNAQFITLRHGDGSFDLSTAEWATPYKTVNSVGPKPTKLNDIVSIGDIVRVTKNEDQSWSLMQVPEAQASLVSVSPKNGAIQALVGGFDFAQSHYNRATQAKRQPGSNFKPFVYLAALENGSTASTLINDAPIVFEDKNLEAMWRPENSSGKFYGPTRIRKALYNSRNLVSIRLLKSTGVRKTLRHVNKYGFDTEKLPADLSLALGSAAMAPIKIATGYGMIANGGYYIEPYLIERIESEEGEILFEASPYTVCEDCQSLTASQENEEDQEIPTDKVAARIADERSIYIMHSMLRDVITKGTGRRALVLKRDDIAGKTGTTNDQKDAWFSGFNADFATSVWVGFDEPKTLGRREYGARAALPIWIDFMRVALEDQPSSLMKQPSGIVTVKIDPTTGELAEPGNRNAIFEIFREENVPRSSVAKASSPATRDLGTDEPIKPEDIF